LLAVATVSVFARELGPAGYANWTLAVAISAFLVGALMQPLHVSLTRFLPRPGYAALAPTLGRLILGIGVCLVGVVAILKIAAPLWFPVGVLGMALALGLSQAVFDFSGQHLAACAQARRYSALYLTKSFLALGFGFVLLKAGAGAWGAVGGTALAFVLAVLIFGRRTWLAVLQGAFDRTVFRQIRGYALAIGFAFMAGALLQWGDRLILAHFVPAGHLGAYGAAADVAQQGFGLLFSAFHLAWFPRLAAAWERREAGLRDQLDRYVRVSLAILLPATVGFALVSGDVTELILGSAFRQDAALVMPWLALGAAVGGVRTYLLDIPLHLSERMVIQSMITAGCGLCAVLLNLWLTPRYGILAAAVVGVAMQLLGCFASIFIGRRILKLHLALRDVVAIGAGLLAMAGVVWMLPSGTVVWMLIRIAVGAVVYGAVLLGFDTAGVRSWARLRFQMGRRQ
jgi:O-antigen/teichoic acid export membrane protein